MPGRHRRNRTSITAALLQTMQDPGCGGSGPGSCLHPAGGGIPDTSQEFGVITGRLTQQFGHRKWRMSWRKAPQTRMTDGPLAKPITARPIAMPKKLMMSIAMGESPSFRVFDDIQR